VQSGIERSLFDAQQFVADALDARSDPLRFLAELLLHYDSPVSVAFDLTDARTAGVAAVLFQMRYVMAEDNLPLAIEELLNQVHAMLVTEISMRGIGEVETPSVEALVDSPGLVAV